MLLPYFSILTLSDHSFLLAQDVTNLEEAKQILIGQKLEAQNAVERMEAQVKASKDELEQLRADSQRVAEMLRAENSALQDKLVG